MKIQRYTLAISMVILLAACGKQESAPATAPDASAPVASTPTESPAATTPAAPAAPVAENALGKATYGKTCSMCHAANVAGAPKPGDKADWGPRIAQGKEVLYKHALEGFTGAKGQMPARGGNAALKDEEVKAAVDYMTDASR